MDEVMNRIWAESSSGLSTPESLSDEVLSTASSEEDTCKKLDLPVVPYKSDIDSEIEKLFESPFTWGIDESLVANFDENLELITQWDEQPVIALVETIAMVFIYTTKDNSEKAQEKMESVIKMFKEYDFYDKLVKENIVPLVLNHIIETTRYYYRKYENRKNEKHMNELDYAQFIATIPDIKNNWNVSKSDVTYGTLNGCKSIVWSMFHEGGISKAIDYAEEAVRFNPKCALWHFLLGKNLRRRRRHEIFRHQPGPVESRHLLNAYELSKGEPYYGIFVAQMFRESKQLDKARFMSRNIYEVRELMSTGIKLRLALAFVRSNDFARAGVCLGSVVSSTPPNVLANNAMYLHYIGIYCLEKYRDYENAVTFFSKAAKLGNVTAELQYVEVMIKYYPRFDAIQYYKGMISRYENRKPLIQQLSLNIAMLYFMKEKDIKNAMMYFAKAITIDPESNQLKKFNNRLIDHKDYNIPNFIRNRVLYEFDKTYPRIPEDLKDVYKFLRNILD